MRRDEDADFSLEDRQDCYIRIPRNYDPFYPDSYHRDDYTPDLEDEDAEY